MSQCTAPLTLVSDNTDLGWGSNKQELDMMCTKLMDGLACINTFTVMCLNQEQRAYFNIIYSGTIQVKCAMKTAIVLGPMSML